MSTAGGLGVIVMERRGARNIDSFDLLSISFTDGLAHIKQKQLLGVLFKSIQCIKYSLLDYLIDCTLYSV